MEDMVFISYSRKDLHFSESLAYALRSQGVNPWMDILMLKPGENWESEIHSSIRSCKAFVLIATEESLKSENVESEWKEAIQLNKLMYVIFWEAVNLPPHLYNNASCIDMRTNFDARLITLVGALKSYQKLPFCRVGSHRWPKLDWWLWLPLSGLMLFDIQILLILLFNTHIPHFERPMPK